MQPRNPNKCKLPKGRGHNCLLLRLVTSALGGEKTKGIHETEKGVKCRQ